MSSLSDDLNSLSGLAQALTDLESNLGALDKRSVNEEVLERLKDQINLLQVACPNHEGVLKARVWWYEAVLSAWGREVDPMSDKPPKMLQSPLKGMVDHFIRRNYLKEHFGYLYRRVEAMYREFCAFRNKGEEVQKFYKKGLDDLRSRLEEGKL